ncbi:uncharacterized protein B0H18DRAFT_1006260 [Fomitopsis serialis]|uniref:uncharacterized protein n=1 Tax=Fomitopsis serialis TaxID=139415 RepID=UPI002007EE21|nr:uncharacterized protein B0H18DRAFT_1006260 [Neoantrodia serialis]KAH9926470.1 hypothetical protein B0H18DRAFT_1006260 [Neoantrodia serialis]
MTSGMAGMPTSLITLNDDVFATLVSYLDSTTLKFFTYMLNDMPHRLFALHELRLHCVVLSPPELRVHVTNETEELYAAGATLLAKMLRGTANLRTLVMDSAEVWMSYEPQLIEVLASMQTLQEIEVQFVGANTAKLINKMQSAPVRMAFNEPRQRTRKRLLLHPQLRLPSVEYLSAQDPHNLPEPIELARDFPVWKNVVPVHLCQLIRQPSYTYGGISWSGSPASVAIDPGARANTTSAMSNIDPVAVIVELDGTWHRRIATRLRYLAVAIYGDCRQLDIANWWTTLCSALADSNVICFELRFLCDAGDSQSVNGATSASNDSSVCSFKQELVDVLGASARKTPITLRYLSLDVRPEGESLWRYDFLAPDHSQVLTTYSDLHWWSLEGVEAARVARVLDPAKGERIAAYLRSVRYDYTVDFDGLSVLSLAGGSD